MLVLLTLAWQNREVFRGRNFCGLDQNLHHQLPKLLPIETFPLLENLADHEALTGILFYDSMIPDWSVHLAALELDESWNQSCFCCGSIGLWHYLIFHILLLGSSIQHDNWQLVRQIKELQEEEVNGADQNDVLSTFYLSVPHNQLMHLQHLGGIRLRSFCPCMSLL